ncbi:MAG: restriction endonuclease subunit S [Candidatus Thiodiazotropha sp.]
MTARVALGDIAKIYSGGTPSRSNPSYWDGDIPWIKTTQIQNGLITTDEVDEWITEDGMKNSSAKVVPKGTILMAMYGQGKTRGQVAILGIDAAINQACAAIQLKDGISRDFIYQQLLFQYNSIRGLSNTGGQQNLSAELLREISLSLPSYHEQNTIANLLLIWDSAIEILDQLILAKQAQRKGLMQQLLSGKRRFPGIISSEERIEVRWGSYPTDWQYLPIGDIAEQVSEKNRNGSELPVLSCTKHNGLVDSLKYFGKQVFSKDLSTYKIVRRDQFAYATNHIEEGSIGYQDIYDEAVISPMYTVFETDDGINDRFLYLVLKTELYRHIFEANTSASVDRRGSLRWKEFSKIHIPVPSLDEQRAIVEVFDCCDRELKLLGQQLDAFKEQKRGLMQQLLTGKVRVKPAKEAVA